MNHCIRKYNHKVGLNYWHLEWNTKYRYKMMSKFGNRNLVKAAILKSAFENNIQIHSIEVLPEHVHLLVTLPRGMTDSKAFNLLKGRSAYLIFKNKINFLFRYPRRHFWSTGGCAITVGYNDYGTAKGYIDNQFTHHGEI